MKLPDYEENKLSLGMTGDKEQQTANPREKGKDLTSEGLNSYNFFDF